MYEKLLFTEMNTVVAIKIRDKATSRLLLRAITMNENLTSLGYTFKPQDLIKLSMCDELDNVYDIISSYIPDIKAKPMYPNFPTQVMNMEEGEFRFHQMCHYFSTYGIETLFGVEVPKGWLPTVEDTDKNVEDTTLLKCKVISLVSYEESYKIVNKVLSKTERLTLPEAQLVKDMFNLIGKVEADITFKENINLLIENDFRSKNNSTMRLSCSLLTELSKHTGDILDFADYIMKKDGFVIRTSQKRALIKAMESFSKASFTQNIALKRMRNLTILRYLSYNRISHNEENKNIVSELRKNNIDTWNSSVEKALSQRGKTQDKDILDYICLRSGYALRMIERLLRMGFNQKDIVYSLAPQVKNMNMQTLVSINNYAHSVSYIENEKSSGELGHTVEYIIAEKMKSIDTCIRDKKVFIDETMFSFKDSIIETNDKLSEGGYIRSGLAIKIPEEVRKLRFFTYWNDKKRIDIDLHCYATDIKNNNYHVGWDGCYNQYGITHSGDITHSDAAEYIDIDFDKAQEAGIVDVSAEINSFTRVPFSEIEIVFTGMLAVDKVEENVKLYDNKNLLFRHDLQSNCCELDYCKIDIDKKILKLQGKKDLKSTFTVDWYLSLLCIQQKATIVHDKSKADYVISLDKTLDNNNISLIDNNYFMDL